MDINNGNDQKFIKKVILMNFQNHMNTEVDLTPGINLITGTSDSGKSAFLRALGFAYYNLHDDKSVITHGEKECSVVIVFSDDVVYERVRNQKSNFARITYPDGSVNMGKIVDRKLPDFVIKELGYPPFFKKENQKYTPIAYAEQFEPLFLVGLNSSDLPRAISDLTGVSNLQKAANILSKKNLSLVKEINLSKQFIEKKNIELSKYDYLADSLIELSKMDDMCDKLKQMQSSCDSVLKLRDTYTTLKSSLLNANAMQGNEDLLNVILENIKNVKKMISDFKSMHKKYAKFMDIKNTFTKKIAFNDFYKNSDLSMHYKKIHSSMSAYQSMRGLLIEHQERTDKIQNSKDIISQLSASNAELHAEKADIIKYMKQNRMWCNVCNRPMAKKEKSID